MYKTIVIYMHREGLLALEWLHVYINI